MFSGRGRRRACPPVLKLSCTRDVRHGYIPLSSRRNQTQTLSSISKFEFDFVFQRRQKLLHLSTRGGLTPPPGLGRRFHLPVSALRRDLQLHDSSHGHRHRCLSTLTTPRYVLDRKRNHGEDLYRRRLG